MTLTAITESQLCHSVPRASFEWPAPYTDWTKAIAVWLPFSENWINQRKLETVTGGFECLNSVLTACWADSTTPFHVNSGGTFVEAPSHCTLDDYDSQFFRTVLLSLLPFSFVDNTNQMKGKHSERERERDYGFWKEFLEISFSESSLCAK